MTLKSPVTLHNRTVRVHIDGLIERFNPITEQWEAAPLTKTSDLTHDANSHFVTVRQPGGNYIKHYAHRLFAEAFIDNPDPDTLTVVTPKDGDHTNLSIDNLEWTDQSYSEQKRLEGWRQWRKDNAVPCQRCGKPYISKVDHVFCTECRELNEMERKQAERQNKRVDPLKTLDLSQLAERPRVYVKHRLEGKTYQEIADIEGVSKQAVSNAIKRAMKKHKNTDYTVNQTKGGNHNGTH